MSKLANMFAVLNLDAEDDREEVEKPTSSKPKAAPAPRKPGKIALPPLPDRGCYGLMVLTRFLSSISTYSFGDLAALHNVSQFVSP
jgi:hypothetical protein